MKDDEDRTHRRPQPQPNARYQLTPYTQVRSWPRGSVIFDTRSGDTHLVEDMASVLLHQLGATPLSFAELEARVSEALGVNLDGELSQEVFRLTTELLRLGILSRADSASA